jgi:hypothetical protein
MSAGVCLPAAATAEEAPRLAVLVQVRRLP